MICKWSYHGDHRSRELCVSRILLHIHNINQSLYGNYQWLCKNALRAKTRWSWKAYAKWMENSEGDRRCTHANL